MISAIEQWFLNRLPSRRGATGVSVEVSSEGLRLTGPTGERRVPWGDVDRVTAARSEQFIGDTIVLVLGLRHGPPITITEHDPSWPAMTAQLTEALPGSLDYPVWGVKLLAAKAGTVDVFRRS